jgi:hypothetical protein
MQSRVHHDTKLSAMQGQYFAEQRFATNLFDLIHTRGASAIYDCARRRHPYGSTPSTSRAVVCAQSAPHTQPKAQHSAKQTCHIVNYKLNHLEFSAGGLLSGMQLARVSNAIVEQAVLYTTRKLSVRRHGATERDTMACDPRQRCLDRNRQVLNTNRTSRRRHLAASEVMPVSRPGHTATGSPTRLELKTCFSAWSG